MTLQAIDLLDPDFSGPLALHAPQLIERRHVMDRAAAIGLVVVDADREFVVKTRKLTKRLGGPRRLTSQMVRMAKLVAAGMQPADAAQRVGLQRKAGRHLSTSPLFQAAVAAAKEQRP